MLQVFPLLVEYCRVEPVGQEATGGEMRPPLGVPPKTVQTLFTTTATGAGVVKIGQGGHVPGAVVIVFVGLETIGSALQLQRVRTVCAGPVWAYVGTVVLQVPPLLVEYCRVEPVGQEATGGEMAPPLGVPPKTVQTLFTTTATGAGVVKTGQAGHRPGAVVIIADWLEICGFSSQLQRVRIVCGGPSWSYVGTVVLQVPPLLVEYSRSEPSGQEACGAVMEPPFGVPPKTVQMLFEIFGVGGITFVKSGHSGQMPGEVVTILVGLVTCGFALQSQRVRIVCAGPFWSYVGTVVLQVPPLFVEYCRVEPVGQDATGGEIIPPLGVPPKTVQTLFTTTATGAGVVKTGHGGHVPGAVVTVLVGLEICGLSLQLQRVKIVCAGPSWSYTGMVVLQVPPLFVEYCRVEPVGQEATGGEMRPPLGVPPKTVQTLFDEITAGGACAVKTGHCTVLG